MHGLVEPGPEPGQKRDGSGLPLAQPLRVAQILDLPLDPEHRSVERQRLMRPTRQQAARGQDRS